jgi:hypothetical protein
MKKMLTVFTCFVILGSCNSSKGISTKKMQNQDIGILRSSCVYKIRFKNVFPYNPSDMIEYSINDDKNNSFMGQFMGNAIDTTILYKPIGEWYKNFTLSYTVYRNRLTTNFPLQPLFCNSLDTSILLVKY